MGATVRPAAVAGTFYPGNAPELARTVDRLIPAHARLDTMPKILLVPHAGYIYSGPIAGSAYALLAGARDLVRRVVLLGPTHRVPVRGLAAPSVQRFTTPLGEVAVDRAAIARIADLPQVVIQDAAHALEHSLEVQLPFLQRMLGSSFALVPLAVGDACPKDVAQVLECLWGGEETLIVISSDLSHYLPYAEAQRRDAATIDRVLALDPGIDHDEACGATPLAGAILTARRHGLQPHLLDLRNSGDTAGDRRRVVGYAAVAFAAGEPSGRKRDAEAFAGEGKADQAQADPVRVDPGRADRDRADSARAEDIAVDEDRALGQALLARARNAIAQALGHATGPEPRHAALESTGATFVTLRCQGELRGCIGTLRAERRLHDDVRRHALAAAFEDPRFPPLEHAEFADLDIEVSLLGEPEPLAVISEAHALALLRPGRDGVILEWRGRRATFLPQVWEQLPRPEAFLRELKRKAGLRIDFWADDVKLARYEVCKFADTRGTDQSCETETP